MSYDENDAAMDAFYDEMREQLYPEIINDFTSERLQSYFLSYPEAAKPAYLALEESLRLRDAGFFSAAFLFAVIAAEVAVKTALLKPIVHGLIHNLHTSTLITDLVVRNGLDRIENLLFESLNSVANIDLNSFCRPTSDQKLWSEIKDLQKKRDHLVHRAQMPSSTEAEIAISVASAVLETVFPIVIKAIDLHLHERGRICNDSLCKLEGEYSPEWIEELRSRRNSNA
ncbi:MAG: hypothetical protein M0R41_05095 [Methylobacter tundripaludum]|nr:hypothetical protein [Methylobacter tundripaludum]